MTSHRVVYFSGQFVLESDWKDVGTVRSAITQLAGRLRDKDILFIGLGDEGGIEFLGNAKAKYVSYQLDQTVVAKYYQAADVYVHAANAETWPLSIAEAMACAKPVVATAVGGIPEIIKGLKCLETSHMSAAWNLYGPNEATGILVAPKDSDAMATALEMLLEDYNLRTQLGKNGCQRVKANYTSAQHAANYIAWYRQIMEHQDRGCQHEDACHRSGRSRRELYS